MEIVIECETRTSLVSHQLIMCGQAERCSISGTCDLGLPTAADSGFRVLLPLLASDCCRYIMSHRLHMPHV
ncbi:hypothetical protein CY34DRAFT_509373 [Suillus luteus UH-Slu-Lm8-n1]|uniref:Uncharacterized protein n=1 Tax=Suillus luteus UH-Slu-Lm8-n1 TaxID=930992 RepID=A0A0D0A6A1_9AGAM|nr:hypothetical protein CY34DRAFT_509373 [Suillus luteus UH-Slu-Lm8-n1]